MYRNKAKLSKHIHGASLGQRELTFCSKKPFRSGEYSEYRNIHVYESSPREPIVRERKKKGQWTSA